jgi:hypothetical protein
MNIKIFLLCPVPENQKPINEYIQLQQNSLWLLFSTWENRRSFLSFYFLIFFFIFSLNQPVFELNHISHSILLSIFFTNILTLFFLFFQFFRWSQLENRLNESRLFYEEGSWYDGEIWEKPFLLIKNERLLTTQKIQPFIQQLSRIILNFFYFTIFFAFLLIVEKNQNIIL